MFEGYKNWKQYIPEIRAKKRFLLRSVFFVTIVSLYQVLRFLYTKKFFGYNLLISDGFIKYAFFPIIILFLYILWPRLREYKMKFPKIERSVALVFLAVILFFVPGTWFGLTTQHEVDLIFFEYIWLFIANCLLFFAVFGIRFFRAFQKEVILVALILIPLKLSPLLIDHFWNYSSKVTMFGLKILLPLFHVPHTIKTETFMAKVGSFEAYIGPPCAGIHSLLAFSVLFFFALALLFQRNVQLHVGRAVFFFVMGLIGVFLLNSLRVALILLVGAYISRDFAINAFHNNIGAILFMIFFIIYITFVLKKITVLAPKK